MQFTVREIEDDGHRAELLEPIGRNDRCDIGKLGFEQLQGARTMSGIRRFEETIVDEHRPALDLALHSTVGL
jgi:hypothetical protein